MILKLLQVIALRGSYWPNCFITWDFNKNVWTIFNASFRQRLAQEYALCITHPSLCFHTGYELERKDSPGVPVDLSSTLRAQGTLDYVLVKNITRKREILHKAKISVAHITHRTTFAHEK